MALAAILPVSAGEGGAWVCLLQARRGSLQRAAHPLRAKAGRVG
jgi:hypothetical protein